LYLLCREGDVDGAAVTELRADTVRKRHIAAAVAGNAFEFYDFTVYTYFTLEIGTAFFPTKSAFVSLMLSLGTFGAGFLGRPIGGFLIGAYADRHGRRPALVLSFVLMGAGILALALTPSYATIGIAAPLIVIAARILQGVALGGQVGTVTAYLLECAPAERRGAYTTLQYVSQGVAALLGGFIAFLLAKVLNGHDLFAYGWRVAFLLGAAALPFGFVLQRSLPETLLAHAADTRESLAAHSRIAVLALLALGSATIGVYTLYYLPTYVQTVLAMPPAIASATGMVFGAFNAAFAFLGGWLSDRYGRRWTAIWPRLAVALIAVPLFAWFAAERSGVALYTLTAVLTIFVAVSAGANLPAVAESVPPALRSGVLSTVYALAIAVFGGSAQVVEAALVKQTGSPLAPAWYLTVAALIGIVAIFLMPETAPVKTKAK
jgi:MFS family permease